MLERNGVVYYILGSHIQCGKVSDIKIEKGELFFLIDTYVLCDEDNWIAEEEIGKSVFFMEVVIACLPVVVDEEDDEGE